MRRHTSLGLPIRGRDWRLMGRTISSILRIPLYAALATIGASGSLSVFVFSRNFDLLVNVILLGELSLTSRLSVFVELYPLAGNAYTLPASLLLIATAALVGIDIGLLAYFLHTQQFTFRDGSGSLTGVVLGTLGAGCASCGSALLAGLLSLFGAGGALTLFPLDGLELTLVALVVLVLSIYWMVEGLRGVEIRGCPVET